MREVARLVAGLGLGGLAACGSDVEFLAWPALPPEVQTALMVWQPPAAEPSLELLPLEPGAGLPRREFELPDDSPPGQLGVLGYASASAFGVPAGPLAVAMPGECVARSLPAAEVTYSAQLGEGAEEGWSRAGAARPEWLDRLRYLAPCPCERWSLERELMLVGEGSAVVRGEELYLFRRREHELGIAIVDLDAAEGVDVVRGPTRKFENSAGNRAGRIFVAATSSVAGPEVLEFTADHRLVSLPGAPFDDDQGDALVVGETEPIEVYVLTTAGRLLAFVEHEGWRVVQAERLAQGGGRQSATLTWHGPGVVTAAVHDSSALIQTSPGAEAVVFVPPLTEFIQAVRALLYTDSFGLVAVNFGGGLARVHTPQRWEVMSVDSALGRVNALLRHPEGLLMAGSLGWAQLHREAGACPIVASDGAREFQGLAPWRGKMVGWARGLTADTTVVRIFEPAD